MQKSGEEQGIRIQEGGHCGVYEGAKQMFGEITPVREKYFSSWKKIWQLYTKWHLMAHPCKGWAFFLLVPFGFLSFVRYDVYITFYKHNAIHE